MAYLELLGETDVQRIDLPAEAGSLTIGRGTRNDVVLKDDRVSRYHCRIDWVDGRFRVRDMGSRNGTKVAGEAVEEKILNNGAVIRVGSTALRFVGESHEVKTEAEPVAQGSGARAASAAQPAEASEPAGGPADVSEIFAPDEEDATPASRVRSDFGSGDLQKLAMVGHEVSYGPGEITLINSRGRLVHAAEKDDSATHHTIEMLRLLLYGCIRAGASDVHLEPKQDRVEVRLRVDGTMAHAGDLRPDEGKRLSSLVKVLSDIDITGQGSMQEGRFSTQSPDRKVDYRVSFTPAIFGQKAVLRVLDPIAAPQQLRDLGMANWAYRQIRDVSRQDTGMLLICGPTGSGKTTTLYAVLRQIDAAQRNIVTIEDPVEYEVPGVTQIPVDEQRGKGFNELLRSVLRQDPDVILLGEIRDAETATTAMQAANTGHLVLTTIHAKDTLGAIFRLLDLGVEPYLIASTLNLVLAQRLARTLCPHCKVKRRPTPSELLKLGRVVEGTGDIHGPGSCERCFQNGYVGRQAIFELLTTNDELRDVLLKNPSMSEMKRALGTTMFTPLRQTGIDYVRQGITSLQEIDRVVGGE